MLLDLDGTLIDSIAAVERSWVRWCGEYGVDPVRLLGFHGMPAKGVIATLLPEGQRAAAFDRIRDIEVADVDGIVVLPGAADLLAALADGGVPTASSRRAPPTSPRHASRPPGSRTRPSSSRHPTSSAASRGPTRGSRARAGWGSTRPDCLVVEDAVAGLRAARAAGCRASVAVLGTTAREELVPEADLVVPTSRT